MKAKLVFFLLVILSSSSYAKVRAVKCSGGFTRPGDLKYEVFKKCNEPLYIETVSGSSNIKIERGTYKINGWIYDFIFKAGKLVEINRIDRA